jgi:hypothetical protein
MKIQNIFNALSGFTGRTGLIISKKSPEILMVLGVGGVITSTIMACKASLKVDEVLHDHNEKKERIERCWKKVESGEIEETEYSSTDYKKDLTVMHTQTAFEFIKLYGPAISLGALSITCIFIGHGIMAKRNIALMAAYKTLEEGFKNYRKRVVEEHGEKADNMYRHNLKSETVFKTDVDEDGQIVNTKEERLVNVDNNIDHSIYARFFDEACSAWSKTPEYNLMFLKTQQNYWNDMLQIRGHVFLNEVYHSLGIPHSKAGSIVGWVSDGDKDNFIDFGLYDGNNLRAREFINGIERSILMDFNVDGVIYDLI